MDENEIKSEVVEDNGKDNNIENSKPESNENIKKVGTARLIFNDATIVYKFDICFNSEYNSLEFINIINGFNELTVKNSSAMRDFFAMYGIIAWNFPKTTLVIGDPEYLGPMIKIENLINQHIKYAGLRKFVFRVDTV